MSDVFTKLREFLDQFPIGFPETQSGVELKILKQLFTEEEAAIAIALTPIPEEAAQIAERAGHDPKKLEEKLEAMSRKGLVFRIHRHGKTLFRSAPFMIGLYEYSVKKIDKDLAELFREYYDAVYADEMGASNVAGFKVLPVEENIQAETVLLPYHQLKESIKRARKIAVADCVCRKEAHLVGEECEHPIETCLSFGAAAEYYIENGMGREISADEAIRIVEEADRSGLVHAGANSKHLSNICNCCPCCCASLKGITKKGYDKGKYMHALFEAVVAEEECTGCETCVERCPVGAIAVDETARVDTEKCLGCGLCASSCPIEAIRLVLRPDAKEPFDSVFEMGMAILEGKEKNRAR